MAPGQRGQSRRGAARRESLVQAAVALLAREGVGAVSHRSVAQQAGLPLAATTYYFTSLEALLEEAVRTLAAQWLNRARAALAHLPSRLAEPADLADAAVAVAVPMGPVGDDLPAMYDKYLEAGRTVALQPVVQEYDAALEELLGQVLQRAGYPPERARLLLAVIDGAILRALAEGHPPRRTAAAVAEEFARFGAS